MAKIEVFDPALCCPTGVCGPSVDPELTRVATALFLLEKKGVDVNRYNLATEPDAFIINEKVEVLLTERETEALPLTLVDGEVKKIGGYPTNEELAEWSGVPAGELNKKDEKTKLNLL
ncbi:arsenite efflux transporter metallochaperone ArsD [Evansella clarkii]|uniref:arsenite efflux transporter metallochaperone ArsD n=1 Tax=Evansella clarkii TaxID=79879 RepID=UPI0009970B1E|nr:arsenite efflux transporter metallochaperone ArsD [Evansella clarkii]